MQLHSYLRKLHQLVDIMRNKHFSTFLRLQAFHIKVNFKVEKHFSFTRHHKSYDSADMCACNDVFLLHIVSHVFESTFQIHTIVD